MKNTIIIAEIGQNHQGSMKIAHEMIKTLSNYCKVDYIKFQKRDVEKFNNEKYLKPHPNPNNSFGENYYLHRKNLEFSIKDHKQLKKWCEKEKVKYSCSVWDIKSAKEIISLKPDYIKIPSACNTNFELLKYIIKNFKNDIHLSLGMTTKEERKKIIDMFSCYNANERLVLYHCTSSYPVSFENLYLNEILNLKNENCKDIGFSGHHLGISCDIASIMLGANYIERHFTLNRAWKGTDHSASLEPDQMRKLVRDKDNLFKALNYKKEDISDCEIENRNKLKME